MKPISRRSFLAAGTAGFLATCLSPAAAFSLFDKKEPAASGPADITGHVFTDDAPAALDKWSRPARYYRTAADQGVVCELCPHGCLLMPGDRGICRSRVNRDGTLYTLTYGNPCAVHVDPIQKKPLFHFLPTATAFSIATTGCNFRCLNCQNWQISQSRPEAVRHHDLPPAGVVARAEAAGAGAIAYTYSEATTFFEYMVDTAVLAHEKGLANLWISNGYINPAPLERLCDVLDGANVNLKAYSDAIYRKLNGGRLQPVLDTFRTLHRRGVHFEITNLVIPGYTDDPDMVKKMCRWILDNVGPDYPLHFLRFVPQYKLKRLPPTPVDTLTRFRELAMSAGIRYVYVGNVPGHEGENTCCHHCGRTLIQRSGYRIRLGHLDRAQGRCDACGTAIPGVWS
ncbi:MAG: AmmeMemoRadiSam system radical SAM enzyme [Desulfosudaceae bacterium]